MKRTELQDGCHFCCFLNVSSESEAPSPDDGCFNTAARNATGMQMGIPV